MTTFQFTRYLYIYDEVRLSILVSLLTKNSNATFWAYEFYSSGFYTEFWEFIWNIYYDFYASLNPKFKKYICDKEISWKKSGEADKDQIPAQIINNFLIRPWNMDVFLLRQAIAERKWAAPEMDSTNRLLLSISEMLNATNYEALAHVLFHEADHRNEFIQTVATFFYEQGILTKTQINEWKSASESAPVIHILADIMHFYSRMLSLRLGRPLNLQVTSKEAASLSSTIIGNYATGFHPYKILPQVCTQDIRGPQKEGWLGLFHLTRDLLEDVELKKRYNRDWLYYAAKTPIWADRLQKYGGIPCDETREIYFTEEDRAEDFYDQFHLEPDEQIQEIQDRQIGTWGEPKQSWKSWWQTNPGLYTPREEFWLENKKMIY